MNKNSKIYVVGHRGLVGGAIYSALLRDGYENIITSEREFLDATDQRAVNVFFEKEMPEYVFLAAAKVGGILANDTYPADFIRDNILIETNIIDAARRNSAKKLLFFGSSCIYPKLAAQPISEEALLTGSLESTNEWYAIAKIAGIKLCQAYSRQYGFNAISLMPTNLYGPGDNFNLRDSHVLPALIRKFHEAKESRNSEVVVWGTGTPRREFLYVHDLADAALFLMKNYSGEGIVNVGTGEDLSISELAELVKDVVGYKGSILYDKSKPDGTPRKLLDVSKLKSLGWVPKTPLLEGVEKTYKWFLQTNRNQLRT